MLDIQNISKTFEKGTVNEHVAINNLSLKLEDGEFVTVVGSNGAGKSTLFNAICGSFMVDEGHIFLDDMDITYKSEHSRAKMIGRVFQDPMKGTAPNMTIEENLALAYTRASKQSPFSRLPLSILTSIPFELIFTVIRAIGLLSLTSLSPKQSSLTTPLVEIAYLCFCLSSFSLCLPSSTVTMLAITPPAILPAYSYSLSGPKISTVTL